MFNFVGRCVKSPPVNIFRSRVLRDCNLHRGENLTAGRERGREGGKRAAEVIFANITRSRESCDAPRGNDSALHKKRLAWRAASLYVASAA